MSSFKLFELTGIRTTICRLTKIELTRCLSLKEADADLLQERVEVNRLLELVAADNVVGHVGFGEYCDRMQK